MLHQLQATKQWQGQLVARKPPQTRPSPIYTQPEHLFEIPELLFHLSGACIMLSNGRQTLRNP